MLSKKLNLKSGYSCLIINEPLDYFELLGELPEACTFSDKINKEPYDFIHVFFEDFDSLKSQFSTFKDHMNITSILWVSWPKKSSGIVTDINKDNIREWILSNGLVDVKIASIDETWSALKFVYRIKDR